MPARLEALSRTAGHARVIAYQTVVADYLPPDVRNRYQVLLADWVLANPRRAIWAELERDPDNALRAQLRVHLRPAAATSGGVQSIVLASCEYHPEVLDLDAPAAALLASAW
jgi:hypothetical protein